MTKSPKNLMNLLDNNQRKFFKVHNLNFDKLLDSLNIKDIKFNSESQFDDNNYYTILTIQSMNDIPVSFSAFYDFEESVNVENCSKLLKLMMSKPNLNFNDICKTESLNSLNLTSEELGEDEFSEHEIWLVSFSVLTKNDPIDIFDFIQYLDTLSSDMIPYNYKS